MENIERFQRQATQAIGFVGISLATLFYFTTMYLALKERWSFFDETTGDVLFLSFLTSGYLLSLAFFSVGLRFRMQWAHLVVLLLTLGYIWITSRYIHQMQGEDNRWQNLSANIFGAPPGGNSAPNR